MAGVVIMPQQQTLAQQLGTGLGQGLGQGLSSGLQQLATQKMERMHARQAYESKVKGLRALGIADAEDLAHLDPKSLEYIVQQKIQEPSRQAYAQSLASLLGEPAAQSPVAAPMAAPAQMTIDNAYIQDLEKALASPEISSQLTPDQLTDAQQQLEQMRKQVASYPQAAPAKEPLIKPGLNERQATELAKLGLEQKKLAREDKAAAEKERRAAFKETKAERKAIIEEARDARESIRDLDRMEELEKEGKLDTPGYTEFLKRSGLDVPALMEPGSEEFNKIAANFQRAAKSYFGGRVSNYEVEQFLKTIPSLSQSPEGRKRVIANLKYMNRGKLDTLDAYKKVLEKNKGVPPLDLLEQIEDQLEPRREKLAEKFKEDLAKPVPKGQEGWKTALQTIGGSVVGVPGTILGGIGKVLGKLVG